MDPRDPRQQPPPPQIPYPHPRNGTAPPVHSPYEYSTGRSPFPPSNSTSTSPPNHPTFAPPPPSGTSSSSGSPYEHHRRQSDPYYPAAASQRHYDPPGNPLPHPPPHNAPPSHHAQSSSSAPPPPLNRNMGPPPGSPPQPPGQQAGNQQPSHQMSHYGLPPPRPQPPSTRPPPFSSGRDLPALRSINRTGSTGSTMSISSMLDGPPRALPPREPAQPPPPGHYPPVSSTTSSTSSATFAPSVHASPRMHSAAPPEYPPFRRPQTPEVARPYDPRHSGSAAASPQAGHYTPEMQRYGTPQGYHQRPPGPPEQARDSRIPQPPRPSSQPKSYANIPPPRSMEHGRPDDPYARRDDMGRPPPSMEYNPEKVPLKPAVYDDRYRFEKDGGRPEIDYREAERRERTVSVGESGRPRGMSQTDYGRNQPPPPQYSHPPEQRDPRDYRDFREPHRGSVEYRDVRDYPRDPRETRDPGDPREAGHWQRPYEPTRPPYESPGHHHSRPPEYPATTAPGYPAHQQAAYAQAQQPDRYAPHQQQPHPQQQPPPVSQAPPPRMPAYESSPDRQRSNILHPQSQPHQQTPSQVSRVPVDDRPPPPPPPPVAYQSSSTSALFDAPRPRHEETTTQQTQSRPHLLTIHDINKTRGRVSPLPQAVQGAQPQLQFPGGEPGIKSEFGRVFSGLGGGVGGVSSPIASSAPPVPFTTTTLARRDDGDAAHDSGPDNKNRRRRKIKEEDSRDDESSGRLTPVGNKAKRQKTHPHLHHHHHHHHHHRHHNQEGDQPSQLGITPFKAVKGSTPVPSPTGIGKDAAALLHHVPRPNQPVSAPKPATPVPTLPPRPKKTITSKAVLDAVADRPRHHLGDLLYETTIEPARLVPNIASNRGFQTTPKPLPWDRIRDRENCILTVKVARVHLSARAREEITVRRALWGSEVYSDDSDVIAACIHMGWIRGEWPDDVDVSMLDLDHGLNANGLPEKTESRRRKDKEREEKERQHANEATYLEAPPRTGPVYVPDDRDMHVTLLILPRLERYASTTRFGIQSREFGRNHDGLSFMVTGIRWVENGAGAQSRLRGKERRARMRRAMQEVQTTFNGVNEEAYRKFVTDLNRRQTVTDVKEPDGALVNGKEVDDAAELDVRQSEGDKENRPVESVEKEDGAAATMEDVESAPAEEKKAEAVV